MRHRKLSSWWICAMGLWLGLAVAAPDSGSASDILAELQKGEQVEYAVVGWGQSDPVDFFHLLFEWLGSEGIADYTGQYEEAEWTFESPFMARATGCQDISYTPDDSSAPVDMVVCDGQSGATVEGSFRLDRRLVNEQPYGFDPAQPFAFPVLGEAPYISWEGEAHHVMVEFAIAGNKVALRAAPEATTDPAEGVLWLVEDNGVVSSRSAMLSVENMLAWKGDRRSYIAPVSQWTAEGIASIEDLLYAGVTGQLEDWPANNKHLKAWPIGGVSLVRATATRARTPAGLVHEMVRVPDGAFIRGSDDMPMRRRPRHRAYVDAFYIDRYEVTVARYRACVEAGGCSGASKGGGFFFDAPDHDDYPINGVTWDQADEYCRWAGLRLPSGAEWEKAARGTDGRTYAWGESISSDMAAYGGRDIKPVGSYPHAASPCGAFDMTGNMWEMVSGWHEPDGYFHNALFNPTDPAEGTSRIVRGGSAHSPPPALATSWRVAIDGESVSEWGGLRCAADAVGQIDYPDFMAASMETNGLAADRAADVRVTVRLDQPMESMGFTRMRLDLSPMIPDQRLELASLGSGRYEATAEIIAPASGDFTLPIYVTGPDGSPLLVSQLDAAVWPTKDIAVFRDELAGDWTVTDRRMSLIDLDQRDVVQQGNTAIALSVDEKASGWSVSFNSPDSLTSFGYVLQFSIHPGMIDLSGSRLTVRATPGTQVDLLERVDLTLQQWQTVEIPIDEFELRGPFTGISISGDFKGTFYVDAIALTAELGHPTAIHEHHNGTIPSALSLEQNYPNPFNSDTIIRFSLPTATHVNLAVYNMAGQRVATMIDAPRPAGMYRMMWDGTDAAGRHLASGIYSCQLRAGRQVQTRKLLLLR